MGLQTMVVVFFVRIVQVHIYIEIIFPVILLTMGVVSFAGLIHK
jgi:hypothetical protein